MFFLHFFKNLLIPLLLQILIFFLLLKIIIVIVNFIFSPFFFVLELGSLVIPFLTRGSPEGAPLGGGLGVVERSAVLGPLAVAAVDLTPSEVALLDDVVTSGEGALDAVAVIGLSLLEKASESFRGRELAENRGINFDLRHFFLLKSRNNFC